MTMASIVHEPARRDPGKLALDDGRRTYTYGELERLSTNFAAFLIANGVQKGDRVAFPSPKSATLIVAIVGCLKAGATYVPVDAKLPPNRLAYILDDVTPRFVVASQARFDAVAPELRSPTNLIDEDRLPEHFEYPGEGVAFPAISPDDVAYCIYTSGSTGRPKGVQIQHGSVDAFYDAFAEVMPIEPRSRCMNTSELYFDVHVMDVFFPLSRGASVYVTSGPVVANTLLQTIEAQRITHFTAVGPVMTLMTEGSAFERGDFRALERIMTGAEIINVDTMQRWLRRVPGLEIVNGYGPTEATVICTWYVIDRVEPDRSAFYPIGKPMRHTEVLLLDEDRIVTEPGVKGELLIGGPQVMKGYWNAERQTAEKIVLVDGKRYYRSGDICQWLPGGDIDYVGRVDDEIKLSGFRIHLSEIKRVMDAAPSVREGHPVVTVHPALGKVIAACFTRGDGAPADDKLFGHVQSVFKHELPHYMVPSLYFLFDRFPKLPNGKTDKNQIVNRVERHMSGIDTGSTRFVCYEEAMSE